MWSIKAANLIENEWAESMILLILGYGSSWEEWPARYIIGIYPGNKRAIERLDKLPTHLWLIGRLQACPGRPRSLVRSKSWGKS